MSSAFVISTPHFTAGLLMNQGRGLRFEASNARTCSLQNRVFASTEAARRAVESLIGGHAAGAGGVSCRPLF